MARYPRTHRLQHLVGQVQLYTQLQHEYGARGITPALRKAERGLQQALREIRRLPADAKLAAREPSGLQAIRALRPGGPRRLWSRLDPGQYRQRLEGALLARFAGCTLGAPVEGWPVARMEALARENSQPFPPTDYWHQVPAPAERRYGLSARREYTRQGINGVPVDDDIAYTLLGLLVVEDYGADFTVADNGQAWLRYLPYACTAEDVALRNLKAGVPAERAAEKGNPFCEWIGADIRSDPWGYMAPGWPERAADMAYRDAYLSHRRQGIYGEMYFAAVVAAAFAVDDPVEALEIGLTEIPRRCALARAVRWALAKAPQVRDYRQARAAVDEAFAGMHPVHTINNACLTVWGLTIGGRDVTEVIGQTVAMGMDNDCTAATAGSIVGAVVGKAGVPEHWYQGFDNTVHSYLIGKRRFSISGLVKRFAVQAGRVHASASVPQG
ncbi:MAG: ADP-ribosylglycohydrolase family protein [Candidatus Latescibacterota bacterium]